MPTQTPHGKGTPPPAERKPQAAPAVISRDAGSGPKSDAVLELLAKASRTRGGPAVEALERAAELLTVQGEPEQALFRLEEALRRADEGSVEPRIVARIAVECALAHEETLGRLDRAVELLEKAHKLDPDQPRAIEAGRRIYTAVGDLAQVARLYEVELETAPDGKGATRKADLLIELAALRVRLGQHALAADRLEQALELDARPELRERLANLYAGADYSEQSDDVARSRGMQRAAGLFRELAVEHGVAGDRDNEIAAYRRALGAAPDDIEAARGLEDAYRKSGRVAELQRLYQQAPWLPGASRQMAELAMAQLATPTAASGSHGARVGAAIDAIAAAAMAGEEINDLLAQLEEKLVGPDDHRRAAQLYEQILPLGDERDPLDRADRLVVVGKHWKAAADLARFEAALLDALEAYPGHDEAYALIAEHLSTRRDYATLVALAEAALAAAPADEHAQRLEDLAELYDKRLGDVAGAVDAWTRRQSLGRLERADTELRRLKVKQDRWAGLVASLEKELALATSPDLRAEVLRRLGQIHRERHDLDRARSLFEQALELRPADPSLYRTLAEMCELEGRYEELAQLLRRQYASAKERVEKLNLLRRLAALYDERLGDWAGLRWACEEILVHLPSDRDALVRLEQGHEAEGDEGVPALLQALEAHAAAAATPQEKIELYRRLAQKYETTGQLELAADRWERIVRLDKADLGATRALARTLEGLERYADAALAYGRLLDATRSGGMRPSEALAETDRATALRAYARILDQKLADPARARTAWELLLAMRPADRESLAALTMLHRARNDNRQLEQILERRLPLSTGIEAAELGLELAGLLVTRKAIPEARARLDALLSMLSSEELRVEPGKAALELATTLAERASDARGAIHALERRYFASGPDERPILAREIAERWTRLDPRGVAALLSWERVRRLAPDDAQTLIELSERYAAAGLAEAQRDIDLHRLELAEQADDRTLSVELGEGLARLVEEQLHDASAAFFQLERVLGAPTAPLHARVLGGLRELAARASLWGELARVLADETALEIRIERAQLFEEKLRDPARAFEVLREATKPELVATFGPAIRTAALLLPHLLRLGEAVRDSRGVLDSLRDLLPRLPAEDQARLLKVRAELRERQDKDPAGALDELLRAVPLVEPSPMAEERRALDDEIRRLAGLAGRWEDLLALVSMRAAQAPRGSSARAKLLDEAAALAERSLGAPRRAFRIRLTMLAQLDDPLDPDAALEGELWRLAALAEKEPDEPLKGARTRLAPLIAAAPTPTPTAPPPPPRSRRAVESSRPSRDPTMDLSISDLIVEKKRPRSDSTMEIQVGDLAEVARGAPPPVPVRAPGAPPPLPGMRGGARAAPAPVAAPPSAGLDGEWLLAAPSLDLPLLKLDGLDSPWDELAAVLRRAGHDASGPTSRARMAVARMWEDGAHEVERAFEELREAFLEAMRLQSPTDEIRVALEEVARRHDASDKVIAILDEGIAATASSDRAVALFLDSAALRERQGLLDDAEARYKRVLGIRPGLAEATAWLEAYYRRTERLDALAELLEQRLDDVFDRAASTKRGNQALELAELYERSGKKYEAIATLEGLLNREPEHAAALVLLERLYEAAGQWGKVIEALNRRIDLVEAGEGSAKHPEARKLRMRVATLLENELERPERALDAYRALDRGLYDPAVDAAQERLMTQLSRWADLATLFARRQDLAHDTAEKLEALRKRAQLIIDHAPPGESLIAVLRQTLALAPEDEPTLEALEAQLREHHSPPDELIEIVSRRLQRAEARGGSPDEIARLLGRLGALEAEAGRRQEAIHTLEQAVALAPEAAELVAELARLREGGTDWRGYSEAREREAALVEDPAAATRALMNAARAELEHGETARATSMADEALARCPEDDALLGELATLYGNLTQRHKVVDLLRRRLALAPETGVERAKLMTSLAVELRALGDLDGAAASYHNAHDAEPGYAPAVHGLADLAAESGEWDDVESVLRYAATVPGVKPLDAAALHRRIAEAATARGNLDEAYVALIEADRRVPGDLRTRALLGRNRFAQGRFREAAQQLGAVAEHADLPRLGAWAAQALFEGAMAETKIKRPARVPALLAAALALDPGHDATLGLMAAQMLERGDKGGAAQLLERQARATTDAAERAARWDRLGRLLRDELADPSRGRVAFASSIVAWDEAGTGRAPVATLESLLELQRKVGDLAEAALTAARLLSYSATPTERARRLRESAALEASVGNENAARERLAAAHELDSTDQETLAGYSALLVKQGDDEGAAVLLTRVLGQLPAPREADRRVRAAMWQRLAEVRDRLRDTRGAAAAFEKVLELDPTRAPVRAMLLGRYGEDPAFEAQVAAHRRTMLELDPFDVESLRAQERLARRLDHTLRADVLASVQAVAESLAIAGTVQGPPTGETPAPAPPPLSAGEMILIEHPDAQTLSEVFAALYEGLPPDQLADLAALGVDPSTRLSPMSELPVAHAFADCARFVGNRRTSLYLKPDDSLQAPLVMVRAPTAIILSPALAALPVSELRFLIGRALWMIRPEHALIVGLTRSRLNAMLLSIVHAFHPRHAAARTATDAEVLQLRKVLPYKVVRRLTELFQREVDTSFSSARWRRGVEHSANRAALAACRDFRAAARVLHSEGDVDGLRELARFALSDGYLTLLDRNA